MEDHEKIYNKFSEIESELKKIGAKHARLVSGDHQEIIVGYNKPKKPISPKVAEIKRKLAVLKPGVYCVQATDRFGKNVHSETFYIGVGNYKNKIPVPVKIEEQGKEKEPNLLSLEYAIDNIRSAAELRAECKSLIQDKARLEGELTAVRAQLRNLEDANRDLSNQLDEEPEGELFGGLGEFFKGFSPHLPAIADRYFALQEKRIQLDQAKVLAEHGYELPGVKKKAVSNNQQRGMDIPEPGSEQWEEYVAYVSGLPDKDFFGHLGALQKQFPHVYAALYPEVMEEGEEEEEEENEEGQE